MYIKDYIELKKTKNNEFRIKHRPILNERNEQGGVASGHYFHQDLLVAQKIFKNNPQIHVDIGSRIDGFVAHVATFREIIEFDIRPQNSDIDNIIFKQLDLTNIPDQYYNYTSSISCLHVVEHIGLGRYGDTIDYTGHVKALSSITKILKPEGIFYFAVPIGPQRIEFNAHRVFSLSYLLELIKPNYNIREFSYVDDKGALHKGVELSEYKITSNCNCHYGCGIFELIKKTI